MRADYIGLMRRHFWKLALCAALSACGSMPTPNEQLGQTLRMGMQQQRVAPVMPVSLDADQTTAREVREGLSNHMTGKGAASSALQAPLTSGRASQ